MADSEVITLLSTKTADDQIEKNELYVENFDKEWEWDKYYDFGFYDEFEDYVSLTYEEKSESEEPASIDEDDTDERSTVTIVTPEEVELEISEKSKESSIHFCFREIDISDSQLKIRNIFNLFSIPDDPGIAAAFWIIFHKEKAYKEGFRKFKEVAKAIKLRPINCLKDMFKESEFILRYYGFDPRIFRAISEALIENNSVEVLDLKDNWLTVDACFHLNELLLQNTFIETLNLSGCRIGAQGAKRIEDGLAFAPNLLNLNLSHCELGDEGFHNIYTAVYLSEALQTLDLTGNDLGEKCAKDLEKMISKSLTLMQLNLSWNSLHHKANCKVIFNTLTDNRSIEEIDLSWNAIGSESTSYICSFLSKSSNLKILNLSGNRFADSDVQQIAKILPKNSVLEKFYIGNNPLKATGALELIQALTLEKAPKSKLRLLDLENIWVKKNVVPTLEAIESTKPWLEIKLGGILGNFKLVGPNEKQLFLKRANFEAMNTKKKKERKNFGHFVLSLEDGAIPIVQFEKLVKDFKLKISVTLVQAIGKAFAVGKNLVDQAELKSFYLKEYPDTVLPPVKEKKTKKGKKDKKDKKGKKEEEKSEEPPKAKQVKIQEKKPKPKAKAKKSPESEITPEEYEFEDEDNLFENFETNFEF